MVVIEKYDKQWCGVRRKGAGVSVGEDWLRNNAIAESKPLLCNIFKTADEIYVRAYNPYCCLGPCVWSFWFFSVSYVAK